MQKQFRNDNEGTRGDCMRACICSLLEISDENVPNFVEYPDYVASIYKFSKDNDLKFIMCSSNEEPKDIEYYMIWGTSPRGLRHSVIYYQGKLVHDPHPEGGDVVNPYAYVWLEKYE